MLYLMENDKKNEELYKIIYDYKKIIKQLEDKLYYEQQIKNELINNLRVNQQIKCKL